MVGSLKTPLHKEWPGIPLHIIQDLYDLGPEALLITNRLFSLYDIVALVPFCYFVSPMYVNILLALCLW